MKRITLPALLAAFVLAFTLVGCGGSGSGSGENMTEDTLKGVWTLDSGSDLGFAAYASFEDESEFEMVLADSYIDGTWSVSGAEGTITTSDKHTVKLSYGNNKLTMGTSGGSQLVFVRATDQEIQEMFSSAGQDYELEQVEYVDEVKNPIDPVTIADDANAKIVVVSKGTDFTGDPSYWVQYTNKTGKTVYFSCEDEWNVNGKKVDPGIGDEVAAGETLETTIYFPTDELGGGLEALVAVDGIITMYDDVTDNEIASYPFRMD